MGPALSDKSRSEKPAVVASAAKEAASSGLFGPTTKRLGAEGEQREEANETGAGASAGAAVAAGEQQV